MHGSVTSQVAWATVCLCILVCANPSSRGEARTSLEMEFFAIEDRVVDSPPALGCEGQAQVLLGQRVGEVCTLRAEDYASVTWDGIILVTLVEGRLEALHECLLGRFGYSDDEIVQLRRAGLLSYESERNMGREPMAYVWRVGDRIVAGRILLEKGVSGWPWCSSGMLFARRRLWIAQPESACDNECDSGSELSAVVPECDALSVLLDPGIVQSILAHGVSVVDAEIPRCDTDETKREDLAFEPSFFRMEDSVEVLIERWIGTGADLVHLDGLPPWDWYTDEVVADLVARVRSERVAPWLSVGTGLASQRSCLPAIWTEADIAKKLLNRYFATASVEYTAPGCTTIGWSYDPACIESWWQGVNGGVSEKPTP